MPFFQFTYATCPVYATHFTNVCHSSHTFYLLHASYPLFNHFPFFMLVTLYFIESHDNSSFMLNFYLFTASCSCCFTRDHYLSTYVTRFIPCLNLFLIHFCPLFLLMLTVLILDFFCSLISAPHPIYSTHSCCLLSWHLWQWPWSPHVHFCLVFSCSLILALMHAHSTSSY